MCNPSAIRFNVEYFICIMTYSCGIQLLLLSVLLIYSVISFCFLGGFLDVVSLLVVLRFLPLIEPFPESLALVFIPESLVPKLLDFLLFLVLFTFIFVLS